MVEVAAAVSAAALAALAAVAVAAAGPVEITNHGYYTLRFAGLFNLPIPMRFRNWSFNNKFSGCVKWQKYQINQKMFLFL